MKKLLFAMFVSTFALNASAAQASEENGSRDEQTTLAARNLERSMALVDGVISKCFIGSGAKMEMKDVYDLNRHARENGTSDVWPYTAVMEAVSSSAPIRIRAWKDIRPAPNISSNTYSTDGMCAWIRAVRSMAE